MLTNRKSTRAAPLWRGAARFLGVEDHGIHDITTARQPGRPYAALSGHSLTSMPDNRHKEERQKPGRESDRPIRLMTAGNAAREKGATHERAE